MLMHCGLLCIAFCLSFCQSVHLSVAVPKVTRKSPEKKSYLRFQPMSNKGPKGRQVRSRQCQLASFLIPSVLMHVGLLGVAFCPSVWDWTKIHCRRKKIIWAGNKFILSRARGAGSPSIRQTSKPRRDTVYGLINYRNKNVISTGAILTKAG